MMSASARLRYAGVFPVVPTTFDEAGALDMESQRRAVDFMIDAGSNGLTILANYSEQFVLTDSEREHLTGAILDHVAGRVPVIVTTTHFSTRVAAERNKAAKAAGAAMVMLMPPYHGATIHATEQQVFDFFRAIAEAAEIPVMIQDAPVAGTPLPAALLARMAHEIGKVAYFKIETAGAAAKLREMIRLAGDAIDGPWDGEEGITLLADLEAGATGSVTSGAYPDAFRQIFDAWRAGHRAEAAALYDRWLPLINYENRQCGLLACKALMKEGGIIACEAPRAPLLPMHPATRAALIAIAHPLDPMVLRWAR
ncbi:MAG: dihydrodipicolinate synthase family protein [Acetobacteraceae bacterium]